MYNPAPAGDRCPFCLLVHGAEHERVVTQQSNLLYRDSHVTAFTGSDQWRNNQGNTPIIPLEPLENLYKLSPYLGARIPQVSRHTGGIRGLTAGTLAE